MEKLFLNAYTSTVTANGMFKAISSIPLHSAYNSYDPIENIFNNHKTMSSEERIMSDKLKNHKKILLEASFLGERATHELASALETNKLLDLNVSSTIKKTMINLLSLCSKDELADFIKITETIKDHKEN